MVPVVSKTKGTLSVKPATGQEHDVSTAQRMRDGDTLKTSPSSLADIALADLARVRLGPSTAARVLRTDGGLTLDLTQGGLCVVASSGQVGVTSGVTLTTATGPVIFSVARDDAGATVLAVYKGEVRTGGGISASAGQAYTLDKTGAETAVLLKTVDPGLAPLECPEPAVIADAEAHQVPLPEAPHTGGGGGGGALGVIAGLGLLAAAAGGHGGGGSGSSPTPTPSATPIPHGKLAASPANLALTLGGASGTIAANESNYTGSISVVAAPAGIVTVSPSSGSGPSASFTVSPVSSGVATLTFTDSNAPAQTTTATVAVSSGSLTVTPSLLPPITVGATTTFTVSESNYTGQITASSGAPGVATVSPASANVSGGQPATFTVKGVSAGTATIVISDQNLHQSFLNATVNGTFTVAPTTLTIATTGTITASEPYYSGTITVAPSGCGAVASLAPLTQTAPGGPASSVNITATAIAAGTCTATVADDHSTAQTVTIHVSAGTLSVTPNTTQTINFSGSPTSFTATATEANYAGTFTGSSSPSNIVNVGSASKAGSPATFTISAAGGASNGGQTTVTISDGSGGSATIPVTVVGSLTANNITNSNLTLKASEPYYSHAITVTPSGCGSVASFDATSKTVSGGDTSSASASFTVTPLSAGMCSADVTDDHGQKATVSITISASGGLNISPPSAQTIHLYPSPQSFTLTASESFFNGTFTASAPGNVSINPGSVTGQASAPFTVTATAPGNTTITVSDGSPPNATLGVTVLGKLNIDNLTFSTPTATLPATEPYYSGQITLDLSKCGAVVSTSTPTKTVTGGGGSGASASFTLQGIAAGNCSAKVTDDHGDSDSALITVQQAIGVSPASATISNSSPSFTVNASETYYGGSFAASSSPTGIVSFGSIPGGNPTSFTVSGVTAGTTTVHVTGGSLSQDIPVTVTAGPLTASNVDVTASPATLTAFDPFNPTFNASFDEPSPCDGIAALSAATVTGTGTGISGAFTITIIAVAPFTGPLSCPVTVNDGGTQTAHPTITIETSASPASKRRRRFSPIGLRAGETLGAPTQSSKIAASAARLALSLGAANGARTISLVEAGYTGTFTLANSNPNVATATLASSGPGSAQLTVTALKNGSTILTISDTLGNHLTIPVTISTGTRNTSPTTRNGPVL